MNEQLPSTRRQLGKGLHMLSGVEDTTKGYGLLEEKIAHLQTAILQTTTTEAIRQLLKSFLIELASISMQGSIHAFYKKASTYMLRYVEEHFKEAIINASFDELRLKNTGEIPDSFIGKLYIWLYEEQGGKGLGMIDLLNPSSPSSNNLVFNAATSTTLPTTAPKTTTTTSSSSSGWDTWGKDLFGGLTDILKTGIGATGSILTGVGSLNSAKALQTQADAQRQSLLQQQQQFEQTLAAQREAQNAGNNAQVQYYQQQLQQQQQQLTLQANQYQTAQSSLADIIAKAQQASGSNASTDAYLASLKTLQQNMQADSTVNKIIQTATQPQYQAMLPQPSSTNWGKIALYGGIALVVLIGGIYIATRGSKKGLRGVEDTSDTATKGLAGATKKKTYKDKKYRDLGLRGIDLKGVAVS